MARRQSNTAPQRTQHDDLLGAVRDAFAAPLEPITRLAAGLLAAATANGAGAMAGDLRRVAGAARELRSLIDDKLRTRALESGKPTLAELRHDARNLVNQIIGYTEMLGEDAEDLGLHAIIADLEAIGESANALRRLADAALTAESIAAGRIVENRRGDEPAASHPGRADAAAVAAAALVGKVLLVEDNAANRDLLSRRLIDQGHDVVTAGDGADALEELGRQRFDAVLLDIMMPRMSGFEVLERMKSDPELRQVPVIVISALDEMDSIVKCVQLGAEDYLSKPFDPVLLRARLGASLEKKRLRDQEVLYLEQIEAAEQRSNDLLHAVFPPSVVSELRSTGLVRPQRHDAVAVMFCDIVNFTAYCDRNPADDVVKGLHDMIQGFEELADRHGLEKIKTVGDAFLSTAGLLRHVDNPLLASIRCGLDMIALAGERPPHWELRVGVEYGPVVAGVVGRRQYLFDVWGDTVNMAARFQGLALPGTVALNGVAWRAVRKDCVGKSLGLLDVKGKGPTEIVACTGLREG